MHLFVCEDSAAAAEADLLGWDEFHKGPLAGHRLAGDHFSLLQLPQAEQLARMMLELLCKSRESTRGQRAVATLPRPHASAPYLPAATDTASADA